MASKKPILCVDFDGVIHSYTSPWVDAVTILDLPVEGDIAALYRLSEHFNIHIYSSRSSSPDARYAMIRWLTKYSIEAGYATDEEAVVKLFTFSFVKPPAFLTIDDRAICFKGDWSQFDAQELLKFKPWNKQ